MITAVLLASVVTNILMVGFTEIGNKISSRNAELINITSDKARSDTIKLEKLLNQLIINHEEILKNRHTLENINKTVSDMGENATRIIDSLKKRFPSLNNR